MITGDNREDEYDESTLNVIPTHFKPTLSRFKMGASLNF